jgi:hypothetical protein
MASHAASVLTSGVLCRPPPQETGAAKPGTAGSPKEGSDVNVAVANVCAAPVAPLGCPHPRWLQMGLLAQRGVRKLTETPLVSEVPTVSPTKPRLAAVAALQRVS